MIQAVKVACTKALDELSETIQNEMKAIVGSYSDTGREETIVIEHTDEYSRFVGSTDRGVYYLDQGNGGKGRIIRPIHKGAMVFTYKGQKMVRRTVHGMDGIHFVKEVADRHR